MTITVAGNKKDVAEGLTVAQLVIDENVETPQYVTVTINDEFVESGAFESTVLKDGDVVEFLYFMEGGLSDFVSYINAEKDAIYAKPIHLSLIHI